VTDTDDMRNDALHAFAEVIGLPQLDRVIQRGRDPQTARFSFILDGGTEIRIGTIDTLWSQAQLCKVLAVTAGVVPLPCKPNDWRTSIGGLVRHAVDVHETPDETFEETVRDWVKTYAQRATTDQAGAVPRREPFTRDNELYLTASSFAKYVRREYSELLRLPDLRQALADLGFHTTPISYDRPSGNGRDRSSVSYYHAPLTALHGTSE
jgi:hypothetical protein